MPLRSIGGKERIKAIQIRKAIILGGEDAVAENGQIVGQAGNSEVAVVVLDQLDLHGCSGQFVGHSDQGMGEQGFWCNGLIRRIL